MGSGHGNFFILNIYCRYAPSEMGLYGVFQGQKGCFFRSLAKQALRQKGMTIEKMKVGRRSPRNAIILEVMRDYGYVDARRISA